MPSLDIYIHPFMYTYIYISTQKSRQAQENVWYFYLICCVHLIIQGSQNLCIFLLAHRKSCLKLLKHLLHLLKERDSSFDKFCSYHAKTTLFHACCLRTDDSNWRESDLSDCFQLLLDDFERYLENGELCNFFIPSQNLFSGIGKCKCLSNAIREERLSGFPIFREQLKNGH